MNIDKFIPYLQETYTKYNINTPERKIAFLSQIAHESGDFYFTEELASGVAYEGRKDLGNVVKGDGIKYKGRGLIQITGRANYKALSEALKVDFLNNPTLLGGKNVKTSNPDQLRYSTISAGWFWDKSKLNAVADRLDLTKPIDSGNNLVVFKEITKKINGGYNGLTDRISKFKFYEIQN